MSQRVSSQLLFHLRNHIPIDRLIKNHLKLPTKLSEGFMRFICPQCQEFRTATNKKTNLARCFLCQHNFNCIDLVMLVQGYDFLKSVDYLSLLLPFYQQAQPQAQPQSSYNCNS